MNVLKIVFFCLVLQATDKIANALQCAVCNGSDQLCSQLLIVECPPERNYQCVDVYLKPTTDYPKGRLEKSCMNKYYNCTVGGICAGCLGNLCNSETTLDFYYQKYIITSKNIKDTHGTMKNVKGIVSDDHGVANEHKVHSNDILDGIIKGVYGGIGLFDGFNGVSVNTVGSNGGGGTNGGTKEVFIDSNTRNSGSVITEGAKKLSVGGSASLDAIEISSGGIELDVRENIEFFDEQWYILGSTNGNKRGVGMGFKFNLGRLGGISLSLGNSGI